MEGGDTQPPSTTGTQRNELDPVQPHAATPISVVLPLLAIGFLGGGYYYAKRKKQNNSTAGSHNSGGGGGRGAAGAVGLGFAAAAGTRSKNGETFSRSGQSFSVENPAYRGEASSSFASAPGGTAQPKAWTRSLADSVNSEAGLAASTTTNARPLSTSLVPSGNPRHAMTIRPPTDGFNQSNVWL